MAGVLVIHAGAAESRRRFREEHRGDWAAAVGAVLEKHGYIDFEEGGPERLHDRATWEQPRVVVIARQPRDTWTPELARAARGARAQSLVEGPLQPALLAELGVEALGRLERDCVVRVRDPALRALVDERGGATGSVLAPARREPLDIDDAMLWPHSEVPLAAARAEAWRAPGWDVEGWRLAGEAHLPTEVVATVAPREDRAAATPAVVRRGSLTGTAFSLLAYLAQAHTSEPVDGPESRSTSRTLTLELMLLQLIDSLHARASATRVRVLPWPRHTHWALTVRHDVDRFPKPSAVASVLARHSRERTRATWYWRARHVAAPGGAAVVRRVASAHGHEVALHTEELWSPGAIAALRAVERAAGSAVQGSCAHGDRTGFRYQGAPNPLWAHRSGLTYTELIQQDHLHPHRFVTLEGDGTVRPLDLICLPRHESLDSGTAAGEHRADLIGDRIALHERVGGLLQVLNHPDAHLDALFATLAAAPQDGRLDWTAGAAADWWRRTHVAGALRIEIERSGRVRVRAHEPVSGLVLERRDPDGMIRRHAVDLLAGGSLTL